MSLGIPVRHAGGPLLAVPVDAPPSKPSAWRSLLGLLSWRQREAAAPLLSVDTKDQPKASEEGGANWSKLGKRLVPSSFSKPTQKAQEAGQEKPHKPKQGYRQLAGGLIALACVLVAYPLITRFEAASTASQSVPVSVNTAVAAGSSDQATSSPEGGAPNDASNASPEPINIALQAEPFPIEQAVAQTADEGSSVKVSPLPFNALPGALDAQPAAPIDQAATRLPRKQPVPILPAEKPAPASSRAAAVIPTEKVTEKTSEKEPPPRAVIIDVTREQAVPTSVGAAPATQAPDKASAPSKLVGPVQERSPGMATPSPVSPAPRVTLVDIAQDGSFALVTNPQTRLPQKVVIGQKLPTGETLQKIDQAKGTIQVDGRTVAMQ